MHAFTKHTQVAILCARMWVEGEGEQRSKRKRERKREALTLSPRLVESETSEFFFLPLSTVFDSVALAASVCPLPTLSRCVLVASC